MEIDNATVAKSKAGKSRGAQSDWSHTQVFSSDDEEEATTKGGRSRASLWGDGPGKPAKATRSHAASKKVLQSCQSVFLILYRRPLESCMEGVSVECSCFCGGLLAASNLNNLQHSSEISSDENWIHMFSRQSDATAIKQTQSHGTKLAGLLFASSTVQGHGGQLREAGDPLDLLDPATSRAMHKTAAGQAPAEQGPDFPTEGGKLIIREEEIVGR